MRCWQDNVSADATCALQRSRQAQKSGQSAAALPRCIVIDSIGLAASHRGHKPGNVKDRLARYDSAGSSLSVCPLSCECFKRFPLCADRRAVANPASVCRGQSEPSPENADALRHYLPAHVCRPSASILESAVVTATAEPVTVQVTHARTSGIDAAPSMSATAVAHLCLGEVCTGRRARITADDSDTMCSTRRA